MRDGTVLRMMFPSHESFKAILHNEVLEKMLGKIKVINLRELAGIEGDEKLKKKHYIVYVIDEIKNMTHYLATDCVSFIR